MSATIVILFIIWGVFVMIALALIIAILDRIDKRLQNIDIGTGKIRQALKRIEAAAEEEKE